MTCMVFDPEKRFRPSTPVPKRRLPQSTAAKSATAVEDSNAAEAAPSGPALGSPALAPSPRRSQGGTRGRFKLIPTGRQERPAGWSCELPDEGDGVCLSDDIRPTYALRCKRERRCRPSVRDSKERKGDPLDYPSILRIVVSQPCSDPETLSPTTHLFQTDGLSRAEPFPIPSAAEHEAQHAVRKGLGGEGLLPCSTLSRCIRASTSPTLEPSALPSSEVEGERGRACIASHRYICQLSVLP